MQWYRWDFSSHAMETESWQKELHNLLQLKYISDPLLPLAGGWSLTIFTQSPCADRPGVVDTNTHRWRWQAQSFILPHAQYLVVKFLADLIPAVVLPHCLFMDYLMHIVNRNSKLRFGWPAGLYLSTSAEMSVEFECWGKRLTHICSWFEYGLQRFIVVVGLTVAHLSTYLQVSCSCVVIQYLKTCRWMRKRNYPTYAGGKKNYSMILRWGWFVFWHHCFTSFT